MAEESATEFGKALFKEFSEDAFFSPAFKLLAWTKIVTTGSVFNGGTTSTVDYSGLAAEQGVSAKKRMTKDIDGIYMTDTYVKASLENFENTPELSQQVTYDSKPFTVVYVQKDPVKATFDLFLRS